MKQRQKLERSLWQSAGPEIVMEAKTKLWRHTKTTTALIVVVTVLTITGGISILGFKVFVPWLICWGLAIPISLYIRFFEEEY